ncbi:4'-phosphopantetheinyl transferase superfamily protein [Boseaceae bacterium BT-24-1]|nr:4'-phosphopantetheinyl transferase superfamily protein [Boseaceae bacterium BT-24-1]
MREGLPQRISPWDDEPVDYRCVAMRFSWQTGPADLDVVLPERIARAAPRRRAEWLAGRSCASEALRLLTGQSSYPGMAPDRSPVWPEGILGSISHSGDVAIALAMSAGAGRGVGIDIEKILGQTEAGEIAHEAMTPWERRRFGGEADPFPVTLAFSAKESLFKALHPSLRRPMSFHSAELVAWDALGRARLRLVEELSPEFPAGHEIEVRFSRLSGLLLTRVLILD